MCSRLPLYLSALAIGWLPGAATASGAAEEADAQFQQQLESLVRTSGLSAGIAIQDLVTGREFLVQSDEVFPQGGSIRIHLIVELFRQAAAQRFSLDEVRPLPESARTGGTGVLRHMGSGTVSMSLRDYATLVITVNDNSAANFLTDLVGMDNVNRSLAAQGTPEIKFQRRAVSRYEAPDAPENIGTPRAVMRALALLHRGAVVDRATSDAILGVLALPEVSYFKRELPPFVRFAGRSGSGSHHRCEAGIVLLPQNPYVLCVMIKDLPSGPGRARFFSQADALIGDVTRRAQDRFMPRSPLPPGAGRGR